MLIGFTAMAGDMLSSFVKRRLRLAPSAMAPGLDQVPESLLPLLAVRNLLGLSILDVAVGVAAFWAGELIVSRLLYALHIRDRPY
ncbi:MAG: CDP-archaeol synthase [Pseudaminobacter sp.]